MITLQERDSWICQNAACGAEIIVVTGSELHDGTSPRCSCGSVMEKSYSPIHCKELNLRTANAPFSELEEHEVARVAGFNRDKQRAPYSKPIFTVYGKIAKLTKAIGASGNLDGGGSPRTKTNI
jgi:hypothetical protein